MYFNGGKEISYHRKELTSFCFLQFLVKFSLMHHVHPATSIAIRGLKAEKVSSVKPVLQEVINRVSLQTH